MAVAQVSGMTLGKFLKIVSKGMVYNNLSTQSPMWDFVLGKRVQDFEGRENRFLVRTALGMSAAQFIDVNGAQFPAAQKADLLEGIITPKKVAVTVEVERMLIELAKSDISKYGAPLAEEMEAKGIAMARLLSGASYRDGSGVVGTINGLPTFSGGQVTINLKTGDTDRGFIGHMDIGDVVKAATAAGVAQNPTGATLMKVVDKSRELSQIVVEGYDGTITAVGALSDADVLYRAGVTVPDLTAIVASTERNTLTQEWAGLEALAGTSGTVHGLLYGGNVKGTQIDHGGVAIDSSAFQKVLSKLSILCGEGRYKWKKALLAHEAYNALLDASETDRRFVSSDDGSRGFKKMGYQDGNNFVEFVRDEFCPFKRIYLVPEDKAVLEFRGTDMEPVRAEGGDMWHLQPVSGSFKDIVMGFYQAKGALLSNHPAAIGLIRNFTI